MRDPELVAAAQHAAARLEAAWERWRALQGLGEGPAQPVVGYVGYALKEPWGPSFTPARTSAAQQKQQKLADLGAERSLRSHLCGSQDRLSFL
jgi:hypothetical protein